MSLRSCLVLGLSLCLSGWPLEATAQSMWRDYREDCDSTAFDEPEEASLEKIAHCVRLWHAYRDVASVGRFERARVIHAMQRLYSEGSESDVHVAGIGLARLRATTAPERRTPRAVGDRADSTTGGADVRTGGGSTGDVSSLRGTCDTSKPSAGQIRVAEKFIKKAQSLSRAGDGPGALEKALGAVEAAPGDVGARYVAAVMHARLDQAQEAAVQLACMQAVGSDEAVERLRKARRDKAFHGIRDKSPEFKRVTGYARIKVGNALGEYGEDNVDNLEASLEKLGYPVATVTSTDKKYVEPHIWFREEVRGTAYFAIKLMKHPKLRQHPIDWDDEEFDIIIAWGDKVKRGKEPKLWVGDPNDEPMTIRGLERAQDDALRKPEKFASDVDRAVDAPDRAVRRVEGRIDRTERTLNRLENTGSKIKGLFD